MKPKWDERAYFMVQDKLIERMDDGLISWNEGVTDLAVLALIRATCSRPGALGKDAFDVSGAIAKWARVGGENVINAAALTLARQGFEMTLPDGTVETNAECGELDMTRLKHMYDEAAGLRVTSRSHSRFPTTTRSPIRRATCPHASYRYWNARTGRVRVCSFVR